MVRRLLFLSLLAAGVILTAQVSERFTWQLDLSAQRINSLSRSAEQALDALSGQLEIIAVMPDYPVQRAQLEQLLAPYLAHRSNPRFEFVDPVREPERARGLGAERHGELQLRSGGRLEIIDSPASRPIDMALNRLALQGERWIVSLKGHGERRPDQSPGGLAQLIDRVEKLGYRVVSIDPRQVDSLPENTSILLLAGPREPYAQHSQMLIRRHLAGGGAALWLTDGPLPGWFAEELGIETLPGTLVDAAAAAHGLDSPDNAVVSDYPSALFPRPPQRHSVLKGASALAIRDSGSDWRLEGRLRSSPRSWNETGELRGRIARNPELGEQAGPLDVALALQRSGGDAEGRLLVVGNSRFISNEQVGQADNLALATGLLRWLAADTELGPMPTAGDLDIDWPPRLAAALAIGLMGLLPTVYLAAGLWLRYRRRRA